MTGIWLIDYQTKRKIHKILRGATRLTKNLTQKNYTIYGGVYQIKLPLNIEYIIPKDNPVRLLSQVVEEMDLTELYKTYFRIRKNSATPTQMLKIMIYAYMNEYYSTRKIESACRRDTNFMYLLEGSQHLTILQLLGFVVFILLQ